MGWAFPSTGDLPDPGIEPESLVSSALAGRFFTSGSRKLMKAWLCALLEQTVLLSLALRSEENPLVLGLVLYP